MRYIFALLLLLLVATSFAAVTKCSTSSSVKVQDLADALNLDESESLVFKTGKKSGNCSKATLCNVNCAQYFSGRKCKKVTLRLPMKSTKKSTRRYRAFARTLFGKRPKSSLKNQRAQLKAIASGINKAMSFTIVRGIHSACGKVGACLTKNSAAVKNHIKLVRKSFNTYRRRVFKLKKNPVSTVRLIRRFLNNKLNTVFTVAPKGSNKALIWTMKRYQRLILNSFIKVSRGNKNRLFCQDVLRLARFNHIKNSPLKKLSPKKAIKVAKKLNVPTVTKKAKINALKLKFAANLKIVQKKTKKVVKPGQKKPVANNLKPRKNKKSKFVKKGVTKVKKPKAKKVVAKKPVVKAKKPVVTAKKPVVQAKKPAIPAPKVADAKKPVLKIVNKLKPRRNRKAKFVKKGIEKVKKPKKPKAKKTTKKGGKKNKKATKKSTKKATKKSTKKVAKKSTKKIAPKKAAKKINKKKLLKKKLSKYHAYMRSVCSARCSGPSAAPVKKNAKKIIKRKRVFRKIVKRKTIVRKILKKAAPKKAPKKIVKKVVPAAPKKK